ncbi:hypothetical protein CPLU01_01883 [Colletotrichum plurivorum]|uniref:Uncharacterized protein n=1 Tax=Colletotrichum plurivorum TaxID=2175906 RepID=A0A8H6NNG9_9PEZI|nr:hypothetical protein CPLU01_01883 [Colletotrichum plurivorum]
MGGPTPPSRAGKVSGVDSPDDPGKRVLVAGTSSQRRSNPATAGRIRLRLRKAVGLGREKTSSDFWSPGHSANPIAIELQNTTIETVSEGPGIGFERLEALSKKSRLLARRFETSKRRPRSLSRAAFEPAEMT